MTETDLTCERLEACEGLKDCERLEACEGLKACEKLEVGHAALERNDIMSASDLLYITHRARTKLNLHHETEILKGLIPKSRHEACDERMDTCRGDKGLATFRAKESIKTGNLFLSPKSNQISLTACDKNTGNLFLSPKSNQISLTTCDKNTGKQLRAKNEPIPLDPVQTITDTKNPKISHYQTLSNSLANWIFMNSKEKIIAATIKGHGWTNIYQYLPTNHPDGIAQIMPILSATKSQLWASIPKRTQEDLLKYFAGIDSKGMPIKSTKENDGVPLILLIQGPKIGSTRSLDCLRAQGLNTVMDQLKAKFNDLYPGVTIVHRWVGKNGYIMEAVWDQECYQNRLDMRSLLRNT